MEDRSNGDETEERIRRGAAKRRAQDGQQRAHERARGSAARSCARCWTACIRGLLCRPSASNALSSPFVSVAPFLHVLPLSPSVSVPSDVLQQSDNSGNMTAPGVQRFPPAFHVNANHEGSKARRRNISFSCLRVFVVASSAHVGPALERILTTAATPRGLRDRP